MLIWIWWIVLLAGRVSFGELRHSLAHFSAFGSVHYALLFRHGFRLEWVHAELATSRVHHRCCQAYVGRFLNFYGIIVWIFMPFYIGLRRMWKFSFPPCDAVLPRSFI
ncbi:hypothetical protein ABFS82_03G033400 [Erythranthe guttata]